jgi:hypothetical protein
MLLWKKISKDNLVLTCGVAFLEIEWTSVPFLLIAVSIKQNIILFIIKRNKQLSG